MTDAWVLPLMPAFAFVVLLLLGPYLPRKGDWLAVAAIGATFVLTLLVAADFPDALAPHGPEFAGAANSIEWLRIGDALELRLGVHVDGITVVMLLVVSFVSFMVQLYSIAYMHGDSRYGL